jgi:hypothetical protein
MSSSVDNYLPAGRHAVSWDAAISESRSIGSGIYFYRLETDDWADTKKMILLK